MKLSKLRDGSFTQKRKLWKLHDGSFTQKRKLPSEFTFLLGGRIYECGTIVMKASVLQSHGEYLGVQKEGEYWVE